MSLSFRTLLRRHGTLFTTLPTRTLPPSQQPPPAAILRAVHNISRHAAPLRSTKQHRLLRQQWARFFSRSSPRPLNSTMPPPPPPNPATNHPPPSLSLTARLRKLSREYGWSAFGIYTLLSAIDFPFCFLAVRSLGADKIGHYEHVVVENVAGVIPEGVKGVWRGWRAAVGEWIAAVKKGEEAPTSAAEGESGRGQQITTTPPAIAGEQGRVEAYADVSRSGSSEVEEVGIASSTTGDYGKDVMQADALNQRSDASIWTQLALAYAIHKSFIFVRVPLTVAVTPRVVKVLRGWGWDIGKRRPKEVREASKAARKAVKEAGKKGAS